MPDSRVVSVNVGRVYDAEWAGALQRTAIDKQAADGRVAVRAHGLAGDEQADGDHGGPYQAVYAYAREDLDWWSGELGYRLRSGMFGENLTLAGVDTTDAVLGERWRVGTALVEVTQPRIPCGVFRGWMEEKGWVRRFADEARPGAYLSVVGEGEVAAGDAVEVVHHPDHDVTLREVFRLNYGDLSVLPRLDAAPGLTPDVRAAAQKARGRARHAETSHHSESTRGRPSWG